MLILTFQCDINITDTKTVKYFPPQFDYSVVICLLKWNYATLQLKHYSLIADGAFDGSFLWHFVYILNCTILFYDATDR